MMKHKTFSFLLTMLMSMVACVASAHDFSVNGIFYNIKSSTDLTVSVTYLGNEYKSYSNEYIGSVVIPKTVTYSGKTYSVTSIGFCAFYGCSGLTSVTIPNSVTSIGEYAFWGCSGLTSVTINSNTIAAKAYSSSSSLSGIFGSQVKEYVFGDGVKSIGSSACYSCTNLASVTIPNSVTSIGSSAFRGCRGLTSITIPNSVTSIDDNAFDGCRGLTSVAIPNSVTSIGRSAFSGCSGLTKAEFASVESLCNIKFGNYFSNPLYYAHKLYINGKEITDLVIPNSLTSIGNYAFYGCSGLTSVTIPNSVTSIGSYAFYDCI